MQKKHEAPKKEMAQIWVTRYALTKGIQQVTAEISNEGSMASYKVNGWTHYVHGKDFHRTLADAKAHANEMVTKKIVSVEKTLVKLKNLTF